MIADLLAVERLEGPIEEALARFAPVVRRFGERTDSHAVVLGLDDGVDRVVVKAATEPQSVAWLESAVRFHAAVRHPAIASIRHVVPLAGGGLALVEAWAPGEVLHDPYDPAVPGRDEPGSPWRRFRALPVPVLVDAVTQLLDAHVAVTGAGFVAVDLYDGCLVWDRPSRRLHLIDLDLYRPGPFELPVDRQYGSTAFMAPEEHRRGATIDERTTVFTLGRFASVLLGAGRHDPPAGPGWRGTPAQAAVVRTACADDPGARYPAVAALAAAWADASA